MAQTNLPTQLQVAEKMVNIQQRLGNGAFGVVYKVIEEGTSKVYAMKDILCLNDSAIRNAIREAFTLSRISHEYVIAILRVGEFRDSRGLHMLLLTEYCPGGSLNDRLARPSSDQQNLTWMTQTVEAVAHLHSCNVVHRDLKADNVLLTASEDVKLGDFGLAREYIALKRASVQQDDGSWLTTYTQYYMQSGIGPIHWVAPEFFRGHYTEKADIFSLGTLLFAILERDYIVINGKAIYGAFVIVPGAGKIGVGYAMENFDANIRIQFSSHAQGSNALQRNVHELLKYNPCDRPTAQEICNRLRVIQENIGLGQSSTDLNEAGSCF